MIEDISFKSPPNSLASTYAEDAVGIDANSINNTILSLSNPNKLPIINIIKGKSKSFVNDERIIAIFVSRNSLKCKPTPTDKSPNGKAAELTMAKVFCITVGKCKPKRFTIPPKIQAKIKGFEIIDFENDNIDILFLGTYAEKIEIHKTFIKGIIKVISNIAITKPSSLSKASIKAKNTYVLNLIAP